MSEPQQQIAQAKGVLDQISELITAYPIVKWMFLAWFFGWAIAIVLRILVKLSPWSEARERVVVFLSCILFSGLAAARMWYPLPNPIIVSTIMGVASPFVLMLFAAVVCWWKPGAKPYLSLSKDFAAVVSDEQPQQLGTPHAVPYDDTIPQTNKEPPK